MPSGIHRVHGKKRSAEMEPPGGIFAFSNSDQIKKVPDQREYDSGSEDETDIHLILKSAIYKADC
ncbi:MAG: hypothetical protein DRI57_13715 [Deltaproteobacteria bacterium]|nr:MAG: hypothetical protein DRI57_13715 [Deltaproteobacteria bacterium]